MGIPQPSDTTAAACRKPPPHGGEDAIRIDPRQVPIRVVELDLGGDPRVRLAARADTVSQIAGPILALVRLHGHPIGFVQAHVADGADALGALIGAAHAELGTAIAEHTEYDRSGQPAALAPVAGHAPRCSHQRLAALARPPLISVVIATRDRPAELARCLASVTRLDYPRFEVIVVDNDPVTDAAERLVREQFADTVTYVREPVRGLTIAHNRGIAHASGEIIAFTDDDVVVDRDWLAAIAAGFASGDHVGCVTGLIVPGELETPAQAMLERHGGYAKGFTPQRYDLRRPTGDPLFPFTSASLGSGANMAFTAAALRAIRGFDPAVGAGSLARAGDDLLAFFQTLAAGYGVIYRPDAFVWHHHKRTDVDLATQTLGYGTGLGAYLTAAIVREPRMLPALLRRLPVGAVHALRRYRSTPDDGPATWPRHLSAAEGRGLLYGPVAYARGRWNTRNIPTPTPPNHAATPHEARR